MEPLYPLIRLTQTVAIVAESKGRYCMLQVVAWKQSKRMSTGEVCAVRCDYLHVLYLHNIYISVHTVCVLIAIGCTYSTWNM